MAQRRGARRGGSRGATGFLDALVNAVVGEVREKRAPRREARQESRLPRDGGSGSPRIGAVRLGLRREGDTAFTDYTSGTTFTPDNVGDSIDDIVARRMRALGIDPVSQADTVDPQREAGDFARRLSWELRLSGTHAPSGLSNMELLRIRQREGRDFAEDTNELREHVRSAVTENIGPTWDDDRAARIAGEAIVAWIVRRIEEQGVDVDLTPLSPAYRAHKAQAGLDTRIGVATGAWLRSVRRAEAIVTA